MNPLRRAFGRGLGFGHQWPALIAAKPANAAISPECVEVAPAQEERSDERDVGCNGFFCAVSLPWLQKSGGWTMASVALEQLRTKVLALSESERAELAHELVASLDGDAEPGADDA